jgi:transcription elongation GreA/GreB family factor
MPYRGVLRSIKIRREKTAEVRKNGIEIGKMVTVKLDGKTILFLKIGGYSEGNPDLGVISCGTPLAKAIIGRQAGEVVNYCVGDQIHSVKIIKIFI